MNKGAYMSISSLFDYIDKAINLFTKSFKEMLQSISETK